MKRIITLEQCRHCGITLVQGIRPWCSKCLRLARENHGVCDFCGKDVGQFTACWDTRRALDKALVHASIPEDACPSCLEWNNELVEMEVHTFYAGPSGRTSQMVCPACQTRKQVQITLYRPAPKKRNNEEQ